MSTIDTSRKSIHVPESRYRTRKDWVDALGGIPTQRIRMESYPATEADCLHSAKTSTPCELVNGILVEKAMGTPEGFLG